MQVDILSNKETKPTSTQSGLSSKNQIHQFDILKFILIFIDSLNYENIDIATK